MHKYITRLTKRSSEFERILIGEKTGGASPKCCQPVSPEIGVAPGAVRLHFSRQNAVVTTIYQPGHRTKIGLL